MGLFKRKKHKHHLKLQGSGWCGTMHIFKCTKKKCKETVAIRSYRVRAIMAGSPFRESDRVY